MIEIYTDGACKGNPGRGGWGVAWFDNGELFDEQYGGVAHTTNNRMELFAVIQCLEMLRLWKIDCVGITIYTDSMYVFKGITAWRHAWKKKVWQKIANADLWQELDRLWDKDLVIRWIRGHDGCYQNEWADTLANRGCQENYHYAKN
jgi:ribonuclease HI